jgi:predicted nucleic acid-binding protein
LYTARQRTRSLTATGFTMAEVVLDANIIVALLYEEDVHHQRANDLIDRLERQGHAIALIDFLVGEAISVLCRRARERKTSPPDLRKAIAAVRGWFREGDVRASEQESLHSIDDVLDVVEETAGALNFKDALVVVLERKALSITC